MRLIRYGDKGQGKPGILGDNNKVHQISTLVEDITPKTLEGLLTLPIDVEPLEPLKEKVRVSNPVTEVGKIICVGLNYQDHADEQGVKAPSEPILFSKAATALSGPYDDIILPPGSTATDWEVELAVIIGREAKYVSEDEAMDYVGGYSIINDVSERDFQKNRKGQWIKGKSADTFAPLGPYLVTKDVIPDPHNLKLWTKVNGELMQDGHTSNMIFKVPFLVSYISQFMRLVPGDVIATGTPAGVGFARTPPIFLKPGDIVEMGIEEIGEMRQVVR